MGKGNREYWSRTQNWDFPTADSRRRTEVRVPDTKCELKPCSVCGSQWMTPVKLFVNNHWVTVNGPVVCGTCQQKQAQKNA